MPQLKDLMEQPFAAQIVGLALVAALSIGAFRTAVNAIYPRNPEDRQRPIKGHLKLLKIVLYAVAALRVFRDTLLGQVTRARFPATLPEDVSIHGGA